MVSGLLCGNLDYKPVVRCSQSELTRQAASSTWLPRKLQQIQLVLRWRLEGLNPWSSDITVTGTTRAAPATLRLDAGDVVVERCIHDGSTRFNHHRKPGAVSSKENELGHVFEPISAMDCRALAGECPSTLSRHPARKTGVLISDVTTR
jgi:hypothetical protein